MVNVPQQFEAEIVRVQTEVPVPLERLAEALDVPIYSAELPKGVSGVIRRKKESDGYEIFVDSTEKPERQRFTAAHELAHFMLHQEHIGTGIKDNYLLRSEALSNSQEVEANQLAARILMPMAKIEEFMDKGTTTPEALAAAFGVSLTAMYIRLGLAT